MRDASLFLPDTISDALRDHLAIGLRAIAGVRSTLGNSMANSSAPVLQRVDDTTTDCTFASCSTFAAPIIQTIALDGSTLKLDDQS